MRIIDKLPKTPNLNESLVRIITTFLFIHQTEDKRQKDYFAHITEPNTLLQIMGNIAFLHDLIPEAKKLITNSQENTQATYPAMDVLISGGINPAYKENTPETNMVKQLYTAGGKRNWADVQTLSEAEIIRSELEKANAKNPNVMLETKSTNTRENIDNAKQLGLYSKANDIAILTSAENAVRTRATARKILGSETNVSVMTYTPTVPNTNIAINGDSQANNFWALNEVSRQYVYGELLRVIHYSETKEIVLTEAEEKYVHLISSKLQQR